MNGVSTVTLDDLIKAALTGQPYHQARLGREARRYSMRLSLARCRDLPEDLHEDIFGQAFVELFQSDPGALARLGGKPLFRRAVLAAIRAVRASYSPPGHRTRSNALVHRHRVAAEDIGRIVDEDTAERCMAGDGPERSLDFDLLPDPDSATIVRRLQDRRKIDYTLRHAAPEVARAMRLIHLNDEPLEAAAADVRLSRFVLGRRIKVFCAEWRAAA